MNLKNLIALVIENHEEPTIAVKEFCKQKLDDHTFKEVEYNCNSLHQSPEDLMAALLRCDAILVQSEWLYKDQLEQFVQSFAYHPQLRKKSHVFYIWNLIEDANKWVQDIDTSDFSDTYTFLRDLRILVDANIIYSITGSKRWLMFNNTDGTFTGDIRY